MPATRLARCHQAAFVAASAQGGGRTVSDPQPQVVCIPGAAWVGAGSGGVADRWSQPRPAPKLSTSVVTVTNRIAGQRMPGGTPPV